MNRGGFAGGVLTVDLAAGTVRTRPLDTAAAAQYIGGLGLTIRYAFDEIVPGVDALSPENTVFLGAGPLVGTSVPASSRLYAVTKLPASGTVGWCGGGGMNFGCALKYAGFDHVVIKGRSSGPVYISITDGSAEIRDARSLWGSGVGRATQALREAHGADAGVIAIGQAGENLVRFSMSYIDGYSTLGRGGFGAVMGSKYLKAIVCRGSGGIGVADPKSYRSHLNALLNEIKNYPHLKEWQELGLLKSLPALPKEVYREIKKRRIACVSCPIGDKDLLELQGAGTGSFSACTSSVVNLMTPMVYGMADHGESIRCAAALDDYGMDFFEFFSLMVLVKNLSEAGVIPRELAVPEVDLASRLSMESWAGRISRREGLGDVLAGGLAGALKAFGPDAAPYAPPVVKGLRPYVGPGAALAWNLMGTMELGQLLDPRGPHVGASGSPTYFAKRPLEVFPQHLARMGVPEEAVPRILSAGGLSVGRLLKHSHRWFTILGSVGVCARAQINRFYNAGRCLAFYRAVTGFETDMDGLRTAADRAWTLLRVINLREGLTREWDSPPPQWFRDAGFKDYLTDEPVTREMLDRMIDDYYDEQGWDRESGIPTRERLEELGIVKREA